MICPECNKTCNHVIDTKYHLNILAKARQCRNVHCNHVFITQEHIKPIKPSDIEKLEFENQKIKKSKRKIEARTEWQEFRFLFYAGYLIYYVYYEVIKFLSDYNLDEKFDEQKIRIEEIKSMGKVINYKLENDMTGEIYEFTARGLKAHTIREVLKKKIYWENFKKIFKKDASEEDKAKEYIQFAKSIVHKKTGIRSEKYDIEFFKQNPYIAHMIHGVGNEKDFWRIWTNLH